MLITDHQVKSVLRTYSRQLQRSKLSAKLDTPGNDTKQMLSENVSISNEGRRRLIAEELASQAKDLTEKAKVDETEQ